MATITKPTSSGNGIYDSDDKLSNRGLKTLEDQAVGSGDESSQTEDSAEGTTVVKDTKQTEKSSDTASLRSAEESTETTEESDSDKGLYTGAGSTTRRERVVMKTKGLLGNRKFLLVGGGSGLLVVGVLFLLVMLSSMKVLHFGQVMAASGYARLNSIRQERTTQMLFDNAATAGDGTLDLRGKTLREKITFNNLDQQVAKLGQEGKVKFLMADGELQGVNLPEQNKIVTLDGITKELGFGEKFSDIGKGWSKLNVNDYRRVASVRNEFVRQTRVGINEGLATESRAVRGRVFNTISDNIGFKYSRWREKARDYLGLKPDEARVKNTVELVEETSGKNIIETGVDQLDLSQEQMKNADRLKAYMEKTGGDFNLAEYKQSVIADVAKGQKIQEMASKVGVGVMVASIACMANQAMSRVDDVAVNNEKSAEKSSALLMAAGSQQLQGDANDAAIGAEANMLTGGETSPAYQYQTGQEIVNEVDAPRVRPQYGGIASAIAQLTSPSRLGLGPTAYLVPDSFLDSVDAKFCNAILSPAGAITAVGAEVIVTAAASFFSAGGAAAAEQAGGRALLMGIVRSLGAASLNTAKGLASKESLATFGAFAAYQLGLEFAVNQLSGTDFMGAEQGADKVERAAIGTSLLQSRQLRAAGGAQISSTEAADVDKPLQKQVQTSWQNKSVFSRYLSIENPYSLAGRMSAASSVSPGSITEMATSGFSRISAMLSPSSLLKPLAALTGFNHKAYAAVEYNPYYDVIQWGYTAAEIAKLREDPSYSYLANPTYISDSRVAELDQKYGDCFDPSIPQVEIENPNKYPQCSADELRKDDEMFRYRLTYLDKDAFSRLSQNPDAIGTPQ